MTDRLPPELEIVTELTDSELDAELTILAAAPVPRRPERFWQLLRERDSRYGTPTSGESGAERRVTRRSASAAAAKTSSPSE
jgi:hypothetical protein